MNDSTSTENIKVIPLIAVLLAGTFVAILNETLLSVAITPIMNAFAVAPNTAQWLTTGYLLVVAVLIPVSAYLLQTYSTRQLFFASMLLFGLGTAIAGSAPVFSLLLLGRFIQAFGTGIMIPLLTHVILVLIPVEKRGRVMGFLGLVIMFAPAIGPTLSGLIIEYLNWRWLFYLVLPVIAICILYGGVALKNVTEQTHPKLDWLSVLLSTIGFGGIVYAFSAAGEGPGAWDDPIVLLAMGGGLLGLLLFVLRQLKLDTPMLDLRALRYPMFTLALVLMMVVFMTMFATMIVLPIYLLDVLGFSAITVGLVMLPGGLINGAMSPSMGYLFDKFGPRWLLIPGLVLLVITTWGFTTIDANSTQFNITVLYALLLIAVAMIMMPAQTNGLNQLPRELYAHGSAIANTLIQVSGAIGIAVFISVMTLGQQRYLTDEVQVPAGVDPTLTQQLDGLSAGVKLSFTLGLILGVVALVLSLFVKRVGVASAKDENSQQHASSPDTREPNKSSKAESQQ